MSFVSKITLQRLAGLGLVFFEAFARVRNLAW
jgi:hypothetical protein